MIRKTTPPNLIDGSSYPTVTAHMQALIAHWENSDDRRCIFLDCYCSMTGNMLDGLTQNRFHDREWGSPPTSLCRRSRRRSATC